MKNNNDGMTPVMIGEQTILRVPAGVSVGDIHCIGGGGGSVPDCYHSSLGCGGGKSSFGFAPGCGSGGVNRVSSAYGCGGGGNGITLTSSPTQIFIPAFHPLVYKLRDFVRKFVLPGASETRFTYSDDDADGLEAELRKLKIGFKRYLRQSFIITLDREQFDEICSRAY